MKDKTGLSIIKGNRVLSLSLILIFTLVVQKQVLSFNLAPYLHLKIRGEFNSPLIFDGGSRINFYKGWTRVPLKPVANRLTSIYRFFSYGNKPVQLYIVLRKETDLVKKLAIGLYLNNHFFRRISVDKLKDFNIFFPKKFVKNGINELIFKVESDLGIGVRKDLADREEFIYTLENIKFLNFPQKTDRYIKIFKSEKSFIQPVNTFFEISVNPKKEKLIDLTLHVKNSRGKGDLLIVEKDAGRGDSETFEVFELKKGVIREKLVFDNEQEGKTFNLVFRYISPSKDSYIVWDRFSLKSAKPELSRSSTVIKKAKRPNIYLIMMDAFRSDIIGKKVSGIYVTPNLNSFFENSIVFDNFYANAPYTCPSVTTFLTGFLPETHTVRGWDTDLPQKIKTLPIYLKQKEYKSYALIGNPMISDLKVTKDFDKVINIRDPDKGAIEFCESSYNNLDKALSFIEKIDDINPSFVYIHLLPPHLPYIPPDNRFRIFSKSKVKLVNTKKKFNLYDPDFLNRFYLRYLDNANYADFMVGKILDLIKRKGMYENSIVIITSDHGEAFGEHGLTEHGVSNYREMIHVPLAIKMPGGKKNLRRRFYSSLDFSPSIISYLGLKPNPFFKGKTDLFSTSIQNGSDDRYIYSRAAGDIFNNSIFNKNIKFIFNSGYTELYDLKNDPLEKNNLSETRPFLTSRYTQAVLKYQWDNLVLKNILGIKKRSGKVDEEKKKVLKSLGYLR